MDALMGFGQANTLEGGQGLDFLQNIKAKGMHDFFS